MQQATLQRQLSRGAGRSALSRPPPRHARRSRALSTRYVHPASPWGTRCHARKTQAPRLRRSTAVLPHLHPCPHALQVASGLGIAQCAEHARPGSGAAVAGSRARHARAHVGARSPPPGAARALPGWGLGGHAGEGRPARDGARTITGGSPPPLKGRPPPQPVPRVPAPARMAHGRGGGGEGATPAGPPRVPGRWAAARRC